MGWVNHYFNAKTKSMACKQNFGLSGGRGQGSGRLYTEDKTQVTCTRCLAVLAKWEALRIKRAES